jgi:hypothetical protein
MRTAPVEVLMQAETIEDAGAARADVLARTDTARIPRHLRENIETSREVAMSGMRKVNLNP